MTLDASRIFLYMAIGLLLCVVAVIICTGIASCLAKKSRIERFAAGEPCDFSHANMTAEEIDDLYRLVDLVTSALERHNVRHFMTAGTLLGSIRHGGLIPWDDDFDLGIMEEDMPRVKAAIRDLEAKNVTTKAFGDYAELNFWYTDREATHFPFLDAFLYKRDAKGNYMLSKPESQEAWPEMWYRPDELFPLDKKPFGKLELYAPRQPEKYLARVYGPEWATKYKTGFEHKHGIWNKPKEGILTDKTLCYSGV